MPVRPRQHYPAGESGARQWAYEMSVSTPAEVEEAVRVTLEKLRERYERDKDEVRRAITEAHSLRQARGDVRPPDPNTFQESE